MRRIAAVMVALLALAACAELPADMPEGGTAAPPPGGGYADFCARHPGDPLCPSR